MKVYVSIILSLLSITAIRSHPYLYNPYYNIFRYNNPFYNNLGNLGGISDFGFGNYANQIPSYSPYLPTFTDSLIQDKVAESYLSTPDILPTLNIMAEQPYSVANKFTVVPMLVVSKENMKMVSNAHILQVSKQKTVMTVKNHEDNLVQCTPAVKVTLDKPIVIYSLKTSVLFPSEVQIVHDGIRIPIKVGAVIAPVRQGTFVSTETPISINIVYAVPTKPVTLDYVNNDDAVVIPDYQAVVVESPVPNLPPKNITVINFPDKEAEPVLQIDEDDDELVNRNPPQVLAPAGIVQSTQPQTSVEPFHNSKESPILIALREEAKKRL